MGGNSQGGGGGGGATLTSSAFSKQLPSKPIMSQHLENHQKLQRKIIENEEDAPSNSDMTPYNLTVRNATTNVQTTTDEDSHLNKINHERQVKTNIEVLPCWMNVGK